MAEKKIPMRKCLGCNEMKPKKELIRAVKSPEGEISLDLYDKACALFDHSDKTVPEIFEEIRKEG